MNGLAVLQSTAWYPPYSLGGTEVYLEGLTAALADLGVVSTVLAPRHADAPLEYEHAGVRVETYPVNESPSREELKLGRPHEGFETFRAHLRRSQSAIYHQHSWTRGCGPHHLRAARELGMRTVLTVHVPGVTCLRGTMVKFGAAPCDGYVETRECGACWAESRGLPQPIAKAVARLPLAIGQRARRRHSRFATALSARWLGAEQLKRIAEMIANADRVVAVCQWLYDALAINGVPADKLALSRQGLSKADLGALKSVDAMRSGHSGPLRLLFMGRWDPVKGVDVVVRALRLLPQDAPVRLTICAVPAPTGEDAYERDVRALAAADARIFIRDPVARKDLAATLAEHDALVVPSIWLETGPLTALEAQAAGLFVLGSRRGGIAELVNETDGAGALVEAGDVTAWAHAIARLAALHVQGRLKPPRRPVRMMAAAAAEMTQLYGAL